MTQLSNEILIAYADGELGPDQIRLVDGVLAADVMTQEQFHQQIETNKLLSQAFSSMLAAATKQVAIDHAAHAPVQQVRPDEETLHPVRSGIFMPAVAAGTLLIAVGAIGGYLAGNISGDNGSSDDPFSSGSFWNKEQVKAEEVRSRALLGRGGEPKTTSATNPAGSGNKWYEAVAARHRRDAPHLFEKYDGKSRNRELALFQFSKTDIAPAMIPVLKDEELTFVGASPIRIEGQSYARLAYRDLSNGAVPVGLYVGKSKGGSLTLERGYRGNDNYVRWTQGQRSYMLIGSVPHWRLIVLSVAVQRQLVR